MSHEVKKGTKVFIKTHNIEFLVHLSHSGDLLLLVVVCHGAMSIVQEQFYIFIPRCMSVLPSVCPSYQIFLSHFSQQHAELSNMADA